MKITELRLGNFVKFSDAAITTYAISDRPINGIFKINFLSELDSCGVVNINNSSNAHTAISIEGGLIESIPLTEEWLLKFPEITVDYDTIDGRLVFIRSTGPDINEIDIERVKYVHQLQNLYFALTGSELEIKETVQ